ncbi:MAG TPA: hypothetical protein VFC10_08085 [Terriglobia bacterium]|nr:hypothetical protein [Terriglobia bacterium]
MKAILSLAFLGAVIFCAFKIAPVYVENYELQDYLNNLAVQATVQVPQAKPEDLQNEIYAKAESLGLPVERQDIKVSIGQTVRINVRYSVYVDLKIYTLPLHFAPSAQNSNI